MFNYIKKDTWVNFSVVDTIFSILAETPSIVLISVDNLM